jgi:hypothetical protein
LAGGGHVRADGVAVDVGLTSARRVHPFRKNYNVLI